MKSIQTVYKIGNGPSSSHTVGPYTAACEVARRYPQMTGMTVTLYGSLAFTGAGHGTEKAIRTAVPGAVIRTDTQTRDLPHPNTMRFEVYAPCADGTGGSERGADGTGVPGKDGAPEKKIADLRVFSVGGGSVLFEGEPTDSRDVWPEAGFSQIMEVCRGRDITLKDLIAEREGPALRTYLKEVWEAMQASVRRGLAADGVLPGGLEVARKARILFETRCYNEPQDVTMNRLIAAYAYAVCEENADGNIVVTAPTCGSCGVLPGVLYYMQHDRGFPEEEILDTLAVAAVIGNVIRTNASISGAECGCQAEIGSACSMTAGGLASLFGLDIIQIEYAAEIAMEHNLGLTCDPVGGLVQIPCIERNAVAAMRAISAVNLSRFLSSTRKISFDQVVATMYRTGLDMDEKYRETSHGGLAAIYRKDR